MAAGDPQTARAGAAALERGGNAVDAAIAAALAAFVCEMPLCSPLGGGVMIVMLGGATHALDLFARVPGRGGGRPSELDFHDVTVDFGVTTQAFHVGRASAAVPLALPGLLEAHRRWARLPLEALSEPAVELARAGYRLSGAVAHVFRLLEPIARLTPGSRALFFDGDGLASEGALLRNAALADALERVARSPQRVAELLGALAVELGPAAGGLVTAEDVRDLAPALVRPLQVENGGWTLSAMPAPSSSGVLVALGLRLLAGTGRLALLGPEHAVALARVLALLADLRDADFDVRLRDPAFVRDLLDEATEVALRERLAARPDRPGNPLGSTTHVGAIDEEGGMAALTLTNGEGSGHVLSGTGMHVNNLLGEEVIHPRGFHADAPGTPLATLMAPTLCVHDDGRRLALGSGGSNRLRSAVLAVLAHLVEHGVAPAEAVRAPRLHLERAAGAMRLAFERAGLSDAARAALRALDAEAVEFDTPSMYFGGVHVAALLRDGFSGAGDARRGGSVAIV